MTSSVDMCGDGSSRHSVGTHGMMPPVCYGRIKGGVYNSGYIFCVGAVFGDAAHGGVCGGYRRSCAEQPHGYYYG